jgi:threonine dehydratase
VLNRLELLHYHVFTLTLAISALFPPVGLAAILANKVDVRGKTVVVVASGGNVDPQFLAEAMARQLRQPTTASKL